MRIKDILCMGCGMDDMPQPTENWIKDFFKIPVNHKPGSVFMYNTVGSTLLGAIIKKK
jgi:CubicO group peptidase (beta-lactamase class C family)